MAVPDLVVTAGSASANSYATLAEAESYFEARLHTSVWDAATEDEKKASLLWSTRLLDSMVQWRGWKFDEDQALQWPRWPVSDINGFLYDSDEIPKEVKSAQYELALILLSSDRQLDAEQEDQAGIKKIGLGGGDIAIEFDKSSRPLIVPRYILTIIYPMGHIRPVGQASAVVNLGRA